MRAFFIVMGIGMIFLSMIFFYLFLRRLFSSGEKRPLYKKRLPKAQYQEEGRRMLSASYEVSGSIEGMLTLAAGKCGDGKARKHFLAAASYLKDSRYRDYETALFSYASDGTEECKDLFVKIMELEARKRRGLPMRSD